MEEVIQGCFVLVKGQLYAADEKPRLQSVVSPWGRQGVLSVMCVLTKLTNGLQACKCQMLALSLHYYRVGDNECFHSHFYSACVSAHDHASMGTPEGAIAHI